MTTVEKTTKKMPLAMRGHIAARNYLVRNGLRIVEDGYSCDQGEVDFVAMDGENCMCFVEVMTRFAHSSDPQFPNEALGNAKRLRLEGIAMSYLMSNESPMNIRIRFYIISIAAWGEGRAVLRYHKNALEDA